MDNVSTFLSFFFFLASKCAFINQITMSDVAYKSRFLILHLQTLYPLIFSVAQVTLINGAKKEFFLRIFYVDRINVIKSQPFVFLSITETTYV